MPIPLENLDLKPRLFTFRRENLADTIKITLFATYFVLKDPSAALPEQQGLGTVPYNCYR